MTEFLEELTQNGIQAQVHHHVFGEGQRAAFPRPLTQSILARLAWVLVYLMFPGIVQAGDTITCAPSHPLVPNAVTSYAKSVDLSTVNSASILEWDSPHSAMDATEATRVNSLRQAIDGLAGVSTRYWKCVDTNADTVLDSVVAMSQAEQDALDQPAKDAKTKQDAIAAEKAKDPSTLTTEQRVQRLEILLGAD